MISEFDINLVSARLNSISHSINYLHHLINDRNKSLDEKLVEAVIVALKKEVSDLPLPIGKTGEQK